MTPSAHLRGVLVAFAAFCMAILGFPGLDQLSYERLRTPEDRADASTYDVVVYDLNYYLRRPITSVLSHLERPLRLAQSWSLYGVGPNKMVRFEILIDDDVWYRAADPDLTYQKSFLRYRRIRPVVVHTCLDASKHSQRLVEILVDRARADKPDARSVVVRCTRARWPGNGDVEETLRWTAEAPSWEPSR